MGNNQIKKIKDLQTRIEQLRKLLDYQDDQKKIYSTHLEETYLEIERLKQLLSDQKEMYEKTIRETKNNNLLSETSVRINLMKQIIEDHEEVIQNYNDALKDLKEYYHLISVIKEGYLTYEKEVQKYFETTNRENYDKARRVFLRCILDAEIKKEKEDEDEDFKDITIRSIVRNGRITLEANLKPLPTAKYSDPENKYNPNLIISGCFGGGLSNELDEKIRNKLMRSLTMVEVEEKKTTNAT